MQYFPGSSEGLEIALS